MGYAGANIHLEIYVNSSNIGKFYAKFGWYFGKVHVEIYDVFPIYKKLRNAPPDLWNETND